MDNLYQRTDVVSPAAPALEACESVSASWLLPGSTPDCWLFRQDVAGYASSHYTVTWDFGDAPGVSSARRQYWVAVAQSAVLHYGSTKSRRVTSVIGFARAARSFVQWACCTRLCESLSAVSPDDILAYEAYIATLDLTQSGVEQRLSVLRVISQITGADGEKMSFQPYRWRGALRKVVKRLGRANGHTRTLDPDSFFRLLDYCLQRIEESDEVVARAEAYLELRTRLGRPGRALSVNGCSALQVIKDARITYGACVVLAFALLGSRKHQLAFLDVSDLPTGLVGRDGLISGRVSKTSNGSGGSATVQPVVPELQRALDVVVRLTGVDLSCDSGPLFRCLKLDESLQSVVGRPLETNQVYKLLDGVAAAAGVARGVRPHMFRRAFSMLYVWRYELGDLQHLSRFLHHNSLRHTLAYTQGDDVTQFMGEAQRELAKSLMERAITGREPVGGPLSASLRRFVSRLRSQVSVLRPDQVDDWIDSRLAENSFTLKPAPHGYCLILGGRARRSKCSTDGRGPDYGNRIDEHCSACGNFLLTERSRQYWELRAAVHEEVVVTSRLAIVKRAASKALVAARRVLSTLGGK